MHRLMIMVVLVAVGCGDNSKNENTKPEQKSGTKKTELTASTPEEFAQSIVTLLAANDPNQFVEFVYPAKEELLNFAMKILPADKKKAASEEIERDFARERKQVLESFDRVRDQLAGKGCDWNQVQSVRAKSETRKRNGISKARVDVAFSSGDQTHEFRLVCMLVNDRWYTMDGIAPPRTEPTRTEPKAKGAKHDHGHDHGDVETEAKNSPPKARGEEASPGQTVKKLSAEEVANVLAYEIGRWKITGKGMPAGGDVEPFEDTMEIRWKVKGKSIVATFSPLINGERVPFTGHKEYDFQEGVFIWRSKGAGFPETVSRERYDPLTKTYRGKSTYPDGAKETTTFKRVSKEKFLWTSQVELNGMVVISREGVFTPLPDTEEGEKK